MRNAAVDVSVLTSGHDVADARLHRLVSVLASHHGLSVEVHGLGSAPDGPPEARVSGHPRWGLGRRLLDAVSLPWRSRGRVIVVLDPDLVLPALVRRFFARWPRTRGVARHVVVDVHEDYQRLLSDRAWAHGARLAAARLLVATATAGAHRADLTVVADDHIPPLESARRLVVRNLPLPALLPEPLPPRPELRALYVGDVRRSRGLATMLAVIEACPEWSLDVVGPVAAAERLWLRRWRDTSPASDRVRFHGRRPPREAWRLATGARVGLCLLQPTPAFVAAMPTKVLEYLTCGLAVLTTPLPRAAALVRESGAGAVVDDVASAAATLQRWARDPELLHAHHLAAREFRTTVSTQEEQYMHFGRAVSELAREGAA